MSKLKRCNLCLQEKKLLKESHIIPEFFYVKSGLYDEKHYINKIEIQELKRSQHVGRIPKGEYESGILCKECDNELIGRLENYGRKVIFGGLSINETVSYKNLINPNDGQEFTKFENVNYTKFKLFLLSILWRACVSKRETFKEADISVEDKERIRLMLINGNAGKINEYPIIILSYVNDSQFPTDLIIQPIKSVTPEKSLITFFIGGFVFIFNVTNDYRNINEIEDITITPEDKMTIMHLPHGKAWDLILQFTNLK
jgi:hypothetical protein